MLPNLNKWLAKRRRRKARKMATLPPEPKERRPERLHWANRL